MFSGLGLGQASRLQGVGFRVGIKKLCPWRFRVEGIGFRGFRGFKVEGWGLIRV